MNCIHSLEYHVVFVTKYRRKIFVDETIEDYLKSLITNLAKDKQITIQNMETDKDHIHMLITLKQTHYIPNIIQLFKGHTSRRIRKTFDIKCKCLWSPSYFICTVSENTKENIKKYIDNQKNK